MKLGTETGSLVNYLSSGTRGAPEPAVGMGCTILCWTDRRPATIVGLQRFKSGTRKGQVSAVLIQEDNATRTDRNGMSESQTYKFTRNPAAAVRTFKVDKAGAFKSDGNQLRIGARDKYYDFSF